MFTCPNCGIETPRLVGAEDGVKCPSCHISKHISSPTYLHEKAGLGREAKNVTIAEKRHIWERTLGADNKVVCKSNPNREWSW